MVVVLLGLGWASGALAHTFLVNTDPRPGTRFTAAPQVVSMQFSAAVDRRGATVSVQKVGSPAVRLDLLRPGTGGQTLIAPLPVLRPGVFVVSWAVMSDDGHPSRGTFAFAVGSTGVVPVLSDNPDWVPLSWAAESALLLLGLTLALGGWVSERFIWTARVQPAALIGTGASLGILGSLWRIVLQVSGPGGLTGLAGRPDALSLLILLAFLLGAVMARPYWRRWAGLPLGLAALGMALQGHLGTTGTFWSTPLGMAHLLLAVLWIGTLLHLAQVLWSVRTEAWTRELTLGLGRYAMLAAWTVGPLMVLGLLLAWSQFAVVQELWTTGYGQLLLFKVGGVALALGLALLARRRARQSQEPRGPRLLSLLRLEGAALMLVLLVSAGLVNATPPLALTAASVLSAPPPSGSAVRAAAAAGFLRIYLTAFAGTVRVQVARPDGTPGQANSLQLQETRPAGTVTLRIQTCGRGCVQAPFDWQSGLTTLNVQASDPEWQGGNAKLEVHWPPGPDQSARLVRVVNTMKRAGTFAMTERATSGPGIPQPHTVPLTAEALFVTDLYAGGGADDVRAVGTDSRGFTVLSLFVPGASIWYRLHVDSHDRIRHERLVSPAFSADREFQYR